MRLRYLPVNQAWAFTFGDALVRIGHEPMFFMVRANAVDAANACGLAVSVNGNVEVAQ